MTCDFSPTPLQVPERSAGSHRPGLNCGTNTGRIASSGHLECRAWKKELRRFSLFWARRGGVHGRMAVCGNAVLGRAGNVFIGPLSLALRARLIFTRPFLIEIVQNIFGMRTHPQCVCCFPCHIIIKVPFSEVRGVVHSEWIVRYCRSSQETRRSRLCPHHCPMID